MMTPRRLIALWLCAALARPFASSAPAAEVRQGDSIEQVVRALGEPKGAMTIGDRLVFTYARGTVVFRDGAVISARIASEAEASERVDKRDEAVAARKAAEEAARVKRMEAGQAEKAAMLADKEFGQRPAEERLACWRTFREKYRTVPVDAEIAAAEAEAKKTGDEAAVAELERITNRISQVEAAIEKARNTTGVSRNGLLKARADLDRLRIEMDDLQRRREELEPAAAD